MFVWYVVCVFVFVRVVAECVCVLIAMPCVMLYGLRFVCDLVFVVFGCVCVLFVIHCVVLYGVLLCVRGCCFCVWFVSMCIAYVAFDALCGVVWCWCRLFLCSFCDCV